MAVLAYHIVCTTYGTWLPGDGRGWIKRKVMGIQVPDPEREQQARGGMADNAVIFTQEQRELVVFLGNRPPGLDKMAVRLDLLSQMQRLQVLTHRQVHRQLAVDLAVDLLQGRCNPTLNMPRFVFITLIWKASYNYFPKNLENIPEFMSTFTRN